MQPTTATQLPSWRPPFSKALLLGLLPLLIAATALGLRLYGLGWDEGNLFHPDERSIYMRADCMYLTLTDDPTWQSCANRDFPLDEPGIPSPGTFFNAERSPLNPHWFPLGSVLIYVLVGVQAGLGLFMDNVGLNDLAMAGRILTALADTGSVLLLYVLGRRLYGRGVGLLASTLGAFTAVSIQLTHFYRPEPFIILLALGAIWFMLGVLERGRWRDHLGLGAMVGLSFALKASSLPLLAPVALTYGILAWRAWSFYRQMLPVVAVLEVAGRGIIAGVLAFAVFALLQPYALLDFHKFFGDLGREAEIARTASLVPYTLQYVGSTPGWYELRQTSLWALGLPLGLVAWAGLLLSLGRAWWQPRQGELLLLAWVVPSFLIVATFEVKFLRYIAPVLPVMVLLGSRWLVSAYTWAAPRSILLRRTALMSIGLVVLATGFYGLAFTGVYGRTHPAVQASDWVNANVQPGASIVTDNHWDEGFPNLGGYRVTQLPMYEGDTISKLGSVTVELARADYLMAYSNRPYGSIARVPERYPLSSSYYQLLFNGGLGYELEQAFATYPSLLGASFVHDPFTRAGLTQPVSLPGADPGGVTFNLGYADENVTNYDHPLVLVFRNAERLSAAALLDRIVSSAPQPSQPTEGLLLSEEDWAVQREGGTWSELFAEDGWASRVPWLVWLLLVEAIFLAALPLAVSVFRWLPDRGVLLARPLGLLLVAWGTWMGTSAGWWSFSRTSVLGVLLVLAAISGVLFYAQRATFLALARRHWRYLLSVEALFLVAFVVFLAIRAANPDLWHPWRGGEKPMDLSYLTAVVKSTTMPPYDPWYAGGYLNYYYFGQFIVATIIKATGIVPAVAYNLAVPLLFALTVTGAFTIGHNLTEALRRRRYAHLSVRGPIVAGAAAALLVVVLGNLDGAGQLLQGTWRWIGGQGFPTFDFWQSSRMMPGQLSITEFPFWTFLFADLHAHLIAIPFTLLALGLAVNLALSAGETLRWTVRIAPLGLLALAVGALAAINTWDVPTYGLIALAAGTIVLVGRRSPVRLRHLGLWLAAAAALWAVAYLLFLPFHSSYDTPFGGIRWSQWRTAFWQYAAIHGTLFFLVGSWLVVETYRRTRSSPRGWGIAAAIAVLAATVAALLGWETAGVLLVFLGLATLLGRWWLVQRHEADTPVLLLLLAMTVTALGIGAGVEFATLENDIDRMNTVFKLYLNAWVLLGIVASVALWHLWASGAFRWRGIGLRSRLLTGTWLGVLALLVASSAIFPVLGTRARLADRFEPLPLTLDGSAYQQEALYSDPGRADQGSYPLSADAEALTFMRTNIQGSPVVLEAVTSQYRWTPRVARETGLPVVVGWEWHQTQQRGQSASQVRQRIRDVDTIYSTTDAAQAVTLLRRYEVEYIYLGPAERLYYPAEGLAKFQALAGSVLEPFFQSETVIVYRLPPEE